MRKAAPSVEFSAEEGLFARQHQTFIERSLHQVFLNVRESVRIFLDPRKNAFHPPAGQFAGACERISENGVRTQIWMIKKLPQPLEFSLQTVIANPPNSASLNLHIGIVQVLREVIAEGRVNGTPHRFQRFCATGGTTV